MLLPRGETANVKIKLKEIHEQKQQHRVIQLSHLQKQFLCCTAEIQYRKPQKLDTECQLRHELKIGAVSISDVVRRIC